MWKYENSIYTDARPQDIWRLYQNISEWTKWDKGLAQVTLNGSFEKGTKGYLTPMGEEPLPFTLTEVKENEFFSDVTVLEDAGIQLEFNHRIEIHESKTKLTHALVISGPNSEMMGNQIGPMISQGIPDTMANLVMLAGGKIV
ncbi:hypothetical protein [Neobacillus massiliamazoniensis]|uniref:Polyketide cyclase / dehydrase and lipid transport n=1 Tax=Neobacillus massiliamazoniensis TaxID=1499688 RepID=A0A0U1NTP1_9BACI|nr:hypothetical protein [Neobacillus massiliamazoniensis]CRK81335.1 Polyketide cyclase / dehydrase and lipid transport [Neobacillus massiliamazoniensis]